MRWIARFKTNNIKQSVATLSVKVSNWLRFKIKPSASGLHTNKQFAADGTGSVPLRLGHYATTEINR